MRWKAVLEYDGAAYVGWQRQARGRSIQGEVEGALAKVLDVEHVSVRVAGRTDAGVHALGQVIAFDTDRERSAKAIREGINTNLPFDIACVAAEPAPDGFDPRLWAIGKHYRYTLLLRPSRSPLLHDRAWHLRSLDLDAVKAEAKDLVGTHDFVSFRATGCGAKTTVRTVTAIDFVHDGDRVYIDVRGNGFLRHMVRIMVGTMIEVGIGKQRPGFIREVLAARDRTAGGRTAPAGGLCMMQVWHADQRPDWVRAEPDADEDDE